MYPHRYVSREMAVDETGVDKSQRGVGVGKTLAHPQRVIFPWLLPTPASHCVSLCGSLTQSSPIISRVSLASPIQIEVRVRDIHPYL